MSLAHVGRVKNSSNAMANSVKAFVQVAVGILVDQQQHILLTQRQNHQPYSAYWEFPGGKLELGEDPESALCRELSEEIGVKVNQLNPLICVQHHYPEFGVRLHVFVVQHFDGQPFGREGQNLIWRQLDAIDDLQLLPANDVIISALYEYL